MTWKTDSTILIIGKTDHDTRRVIRRIFNLNKCFWKSQFILKIITIPFSAAQWSPEFPLLSLSFTFAPISSNVLTTLSCPRRKFVIYKHRSSHRICNCVHLHFAVKFFFTCGNHLPFSAALCKAVFPSSFLLVKSIPFAKSRRTTVSCPGGEI